MVELISPKTNLNKTLDFSNFQSIPSSSPSCDEFATNDIQPTTQNNSHDQQVMA